MHTCPPPEETLKAWLEEYPSTKGTYGHLLLEAKDLPVADVVEAMTPYFMSAHEDARLYFAREAGMNLHPDVDEDDLEPEDFLYPRGLPPIARRGLFGEVMAGMLTEAFPYVGGYAWTVPIFLFRFHADVEKYIFDLSRDEARTRQVFGRLGSDFLGLCLDDTGAVTRVIAGEAKWRETLSKAVVETLMDGRWVTDKVTKARQRSGKGVWYEVNRDTPNPHGLRQLQRLLEARDPDGHAAAILSLDKALMRRNAVPLPRTNLILVAGNGAAAREPGTSVIPWQAAPEDYAGAHDLQVVELILSDGGTLIDALYDALWSEP